MRQFANDGFSLVEMMVGTVLVSIASLALVGIVMHLSSQSRKAQTQSLALAVQSQVVTALSRADTFAAAELRDRMSAIATDPNAPDQWVPGVVLKDAQGDQIAVSGQRIGLRPGLNQRYEACDPTSNACPLRVDLAVQCSGKVGCRGAYRVTVSPAEGAITGAAFGAPVHRGGQ